MAMSVCIQVANNAITCSRSHVELTEISGNILRVTEFQDACSNITRIYNTGICMETATLTP